jgi:hypothetical protein
MSDSYPPPPPRPGRTLGELQNLFFRNYERDLAEGVTTRSIHNKLVGHLDRDEQIQGKIHDRLARIETSLKATEKQVEKQADAVGAVVHTGNTGRFDVTPEMRAQAAAAAGIPTPGPHPIQPWEQQPQQQPYRQPFPSAPVVVQVGMQGGNERESWLAPEVRKMIKKTLPFILTALGTGGLAELWHRLIGH